MTFRARKLSWMLWAGIAVTGCECGIPIGEELRDAGRDAGSFRPRTDECGNGIDDDRNGRIDDGCVCGTGDTQSCFSGDYPGHGIGACRDGMQTCAVQEFGDWGMFTCVGETLPSAELCDGIDNDCDGAMDEDCPCPVGAARMCSDEFATAPCMPGTQTCRGGTWSRCEGAVGPTADVCGDAIDNDCDGLTNEGCTCTSTPEVCEDRIDNDCDGDVDEMTCAPLPDAGMSMPDAGVDAPLPPGVDAAMSDPDAAVVPPPTCGELGEATGADWIVRPEWVADGTGASANLIAVTEMRSDESGNVLISGSICDAIGTVAGFAVSAGATEAGGNCNVWVVSLTPEGTLRWGWQPTLTAFPPQIELGRPLPVGVTSFDLIADGRGGAWVSGSFIGAMTVGADSYATANRRDADALLVHLGSSGVVESSLVVGETLGVERFGTMTLVGGEVVLLGEGEVFEWRSRIVRGPMFVARVASSGSVAWVREIPRDFGFVPGYGGQLTVGPDGNVILVGVCPGCTVGTTTVPGPGYSIALWTLAAASGDEVNLRTWTASSWVRRISAFVSMPGFTGMAGELRARLNLNGTTIVATMGSADPAAEPVSAFAATLTDVSAPPVLARAFPPIPFDVWHGVDAHFGWNACHETLALAQGSGTPQADFGAGPVTLADEVLHLIQWSPTGALMFRSERPLGTPYEVIDQAAWSTRERVVFVASHNNNRHDLTIRRYAFR